METPEQFLERVSPNDDYGIRADLKATRAYKQLLILMDRYAQQVSKNSSYTMLATVPYQLCPPCGGTGRITTASSSACYETCTTCNGQKIIPQAVIPELLKEHGS